jgi:hypothetical protein
MITIERRSFENGTAFTAVAPSERLGGLRLSIVRFENANTQRWFQANYALAKILSKIVRSVEPGLRFRVERVRGAPPTCMWIVKAPLRRGFP